MTHVVVIGCGVVGAAIAYELSQNPTLSITVLDQQAPAQASTKAALGVLMGVISQKRKGRAWAMRESSICRYESLIPELEEKTGLCIPYNRDGIVLLRFEGDDDEEKWQSLAALRQSQGWQLDLWNTDQLHLHCPQVGTHLRTSRGDRPIIGAIHSVHDRQVDPVALTHGLITAAQLNGVHVQFDTTVHQIGRESPETSSYCLHCSSSFKDERSIGGESDRVLKAIDWIVLSTGLGTFSLTESIPNKIQPVDIRPVAGQAVRIRLNERSELCDFAPVVSGHDIHVVPLKNHEYWVGATVEFPDETCKPGIQSTSTNEHLLAEVLQGAYDLYPALAQGTVLHQWVGQRPRPWNRPAPIVEPLEGHPRIILATGHYRNGVLLTPATAQLVCQMIA